MSCNNVPCNRNGDVVEYRQERIPKSSYQERLDEEAELMDSEPTADAGRNRAKNNHNIRYWSDYDRVFYHPRSLHRLPDVPDYENTEGDWMGGQETFTRYNEVCVLRHVCCCTL